MGSWLSASIHRGCRMEESLCLLWQALVICLQQERRFVQEEASQETTVHRLKGGGGFQGVMQVQKKGVMLMKQYKAQVLQLMLVSPSQTNWVV